MNANVLILGGAGFIGSNLVEKYLQGSFKVTVVDGFLKYTGAKIKNISPYSSKIRLIKARIEEVPNLQELLEENSIIIDCMGWTCHRMALSNPCYDLELNLKSHLNLLNEVKYNLPAKFIYLASRGQYGNAGKTRIDERTQMMPVDVQGINKLAAEHYYRVFSILKNLNVVSIRFGNCFGKNQLVTGPDIGLIGTFIKEILTGKVVSIFGRGRKRNIVYVKDLAEIIYRLSEIDFLGFSQYNLCGDHVEIEDLVKIMIKIAGEGSYELTEIDEEVNLIEVGNAIFSDQKLRKILGNFNLSPLNVSLTSTIEYFRENLNDSKM